MSDNTVRAAPLKPSSNVAFITRTGDDAPATAGAAQRPAQVPGYADEPALPEQPCTFKGLSGGVAAGVLGYVFGFVPSMFRHRSLRSANLWAAEGLASAKAFAVMSGIYTTVQCLCERIRQTDDGLNRIIAGGASGVAVAWRSGLVGALQSGVLIAFVSWVFDFGNGSVGAAKAAGTAGSAACPSGRCSVSLGRFTRCPAASAAADSRGADGGGRRWRGALAGRALLPASPAQVLGTPVLMWMGPIVNSAYFARPPALQLSAGAA